MSARIKKARRRLEQREREIRKAYQGKKIKKGLVRGDRERAADPRMSRGWDWVVRLYPI